MAAGAGVHRADRDLAAAVRAAIESDPVLKHVDAPGLRVDVHGGVVRLRGYVTHAAHGDRALAIAGATPGAVATVDELVADDQLEVAVAQALAHDPLTHGVAYRVQVRVRQGTVHLAGALPADAQPGDVVAAAAAVPDVRAVVDELVTPQAPPDVPAPLASPVILPPIGGEVYGADGLLGRVGRVIVDPTTRRVTHLTAVAEFPYNPTYGHHDPPAHHARWREIVVPIGAVQAATEFSVVLLQDLATAAVLPDYRDQDFPAPPAGWRPPLDYHPEDVRFLPGASAPQQQEPAREPALA